MFLTKTVKPTQNYLWLKRLTLSAGLLLAVFTFQSMHPVKAWATTYPNDCSRTTPFNGSGTLCSWDAQNGEPYPPNTVYDSPVLEMDGTPVSGGTPSIASGSTHTFTIGYNSYQPSTFNPVWQHIVTWLNIGGHFFSSVSAPGGISSTQYCINEVMGNTSPYYDSGWAAAGGNGTYFCDGQGKPVTNTTSPVSTAGCTTSGCSKPTNGESAFFYNAQDEGFFNQARYNVTVVANTVASPTTVCLRMHVATSAYDPVAAGTWGNSYNDLLTLAQTDLGNDRATLGGGGTSGGSVGGGAPQCYVIQPPPQQPTPLPPTCTEVDVTDPGSPATGLDSRTLVNVTDSSGHVLVVDSQYSPYTISNHTFPGDPYPTQNYALITQSNSEKWVYASGPLGQNVNVYVIREIHNTSRTQTINGIPPNGWEYQPNYFNTDRNPYTAGGPINCYNATCSILSVTGDGPNNVVEAGGTMHVTATISNTGPGDLPGSVGGNPLQLNNGDYNGNGSYWGFSQYPSGVGGILHTQSILVKFDLGVGSPPSSVSSGQPWSATLWAHPAYSNGFAFGPGSDCSTTVDVYAPFSLTPQTPSVTLVPSIEDPTGVINNTWVTESGATVSESVTSDLYEIPAAGGHVGKGSLTINQSFSPGSTTCIYQGPSPNNESGCNPSLNNGEYPPSLPVQAGDSYCADVSVPTTSLPGNTAYVGPGGQIVGGGPASQTNCPGTTPGSGTTTVENRPFFTALSGSVSAGGAFATTTPTCTGGGVLAGWNDDSGTYPTSGDFGASAQLGALSLGATPSGSLPTTGFASNQSAFGNSPNGLSFANTLAGDKSIDTYSPKLGGDYNPGGGNCFTDVTPPTGVTPTPGDQTVPATTISSGSGQNQSMFINGNVYISGNILYKGDNGVTGPGATWTSTSDVPSFVLHATGNIYIDPSVTELDGLYESTGGKIYTCGQPGSAPPYSAMPLNQLFDNCNEQLTVYGSLVASQVNMGRTFGSLRDETPVSSTGTPGASQKLDWTCGGSSCNPPNLTGDTCTNINEPTDDPSHTWADNQLCVKSVDAPSVKLAWTHNANSGMTPANDGGDPGNISESYLQANGYPDCTSWGSVNNPPYNYPSGYTWADNDLCSNVPVTFFAGPHSTPAGQLCTAVTEPSDTAGNNVWNSSTICIQQSSVAVPAHSPTAADLAALNSGTGCSNNGGGWISTQTCAAEVFYSTPELYLALPKIGQPSYGATQWDSVTSLPPLL